jgi:fibronectin-binding autotransporter adhesin
MIILLNIATFLANYPIILLTEIFSLVSISQIGLKSYGWASSTRGDIVMMSLVARRFSVVSSPIALRVATLFALAALATATQAQTDYYFNPPTGVDTVNLVNTWDTNNGFWNSVNQTTTPTANNYTWTNSGNERANFGNTGGTVTLTTPITAYGINVANVASSGSYVIAGGANTLTLSGTGGVINAGNATTISVPIAGLVGLTKTGGSTLTLTTANVYSGGTTVAGGTLIGNPQASGSPFTSGAITLSGGIIDLKSATVSTTTTTSGDLTVSANNGNTVGASQLIVDNTAGGGANTTTWALGNLVRGGAGSALVITPQTGFLGTRENVTFTNGSGLVTNGILPPWVVVTPTAGSTAADFATYGSAALAADYNHNGVVDAADYVLWRKDPANNGGVGGYTAWRQTFGNSGGGGGTGVGVATYSSTNLATSTSSSVVNQSSVPTIAGNVAAYALKTNQAINLSGNTLTLGNGSGQSGLILNNGGSITGGNVTFGPTEATIFSQGTTTLGSAGNTITSNGLTITGVGATTTTINGNIVDGTAPAKLIYTGAAANSGLILNGANNYSGGTILGVNNSAGGTATAIGVGSNSAFGIGKVTNVLMPATSSPIMQALGGDRTLANTFDLNGGLTFQGTNSLAFTGPLTIIQSQVGGSRTLQNGITASGKSVTYGASAASPSTITLGNPVANGGDGVGKTLVFVSSITGNTTTVINDVMQDPAPGGGAASGGVQYSTTGSGTSTTALWTVNTQSTYSGTTTLNGNNQGTVQFAKDTVGAYPSITAGPFGTGTILLNNTSNTALQPIGGGTRILANPLSLNFGYTFNNAASDSTSVMLTGPIALVSTGRSLTNSLAAAATLTLGDPSAPSTLTLGSAGATTITTNGTSTTVINDLIQDPVSGSSGSQTAMNGSGALRLNAMNTYTGGTNLSGAGTTIPIVNSTNGTPGAIVAGPFGTGTINMNNGTNQHLRPTGGDRVLANAVTMTTGFAMDNASGETFNLTFSGPINMTDNNGRTISNGFSGQANVGGTLFLGDPASPNVITTGSNTGTGTVTLSFGAWTGPIVVNDTIVNPATVATPYTVTIGPNAQTYPVRFNAQNTYTGGTSIGTSTSTSAVQLGVSTIGDSGSITSGPLGTGTLTTSGTAASPQALVPADADRTLANTINLGGNLGAANISGQTFNLNLTGPITMTATAGRQIVNNMAGTFTLGKSTVVDSTQAITLSGTAGATLTFAGGANSTTAVNDAIGNGGSGFIPGLVAVSGSIVRLNNANTYGPTSPGTTTNTTVSGGRLLVNNTSGSGTGTGNVSLTGGTLGGTGTVSQSVAATGGAVAPGDGGAGTLNIGTNVTFGGTAGLAVELGGTSPGITYDQLLVGGAANVSSAVNGTLTVSLISGFNPSVDTDFTILTAVGGLTTNAGVGFGNFAYPDFTHWTTNYTANSVVVHYSAAGGSGSSLASGAAVPEPAAMGLLICAAGSVVLSSSRVSRRRKR